MKNPFKWLRQLFSRQKEERENIPETPEYEEDFASEVKEAMKDPVDVVMDRHLHEGEYYQLELGKTLAYLSYSEMLLIMTYIEDDKLVNAIKELRACTGLGLKESKYLVDNLRSELKEVDNG